MGVQEPTSWIGASSLAPYFMIPIIPTCTRKSASVEPASKTVSKAESQGPEKIFAQVLQPPYNGDHKNGSQVSTVAGGPSPLHSGMRTSRCTLGGGKQGKL